jgi:GNAT superfamily N-acetyltransferase
VKPTTSCRALSDDDLAALEQLVRDDGGYSQRVHGRPPTAGDAAEILHDRPPTLPSKNKHVLGLFEGTQLIAVADVLRGYPNSSYAYIGLLQVVASRHGRGIGRALHAHVLHQIRGWPEVTAVRLAIAEPNSAQAAPFWRRLGYRPTGEVRPWADTVASIWEGPAAGPHDKPLGLSCEGR